MRGDLRRADLAKGESNNAAIGRMYGLESPGLVTARWRKRGAGQTTRRGNFPAHNRAKLTVEGLRVARNLQPVRTDL
jgi:hypothetical protein